MDELPVDALYDLVVGDAFNDLSVPFHLTTLEFNEKIARHLAGDGVYLVNLIDDWRFGRLLGAYVLTLKKTFKHVSVFCTKQEGVEEGRDTFVLAASMKPIEVSDWRPGHETNFPGSLLTDENMKGLVGKEPRPYLDRRQRACRKLVGARSAEQELSHRSGLSDLIHEFGHAFFMMEIASSLHSSQ